MALEQELVTTKLHLAYAESANDCLMCELTKTKEALVKATTTSSGVLESSSSSLGTIIVEDFTPSSTKTIITTVPTMNPFSRKENATSSHNISSKRKVLNPGSCSSAMNLLDIMSLSSSSSSIKGGGGSSITPIDDNNELYSLARKSVSTTMVVVPTMNPLSRKENTLHNNNKNKKKVLNPGSCSSAMNLLDIMSLSSSSIGGGSVVCPINDNNSNNEYYSLLQRGRKSQRTKNILNPGSCSSALNLLDIQFDDVELPSVRDSMRMMSELTHSGSSSVGYGKKNAEW